MALAHPRRIAIFGATGGTGSATVRSFIKRQDFENSSSELTLMVRSKAKLSRLIPELASFSNVHIREGQLTDTATVRDCLRGVDVIICTIGENENLPGCHPIQDIANSIVDALNDLKSSSSTEWTRPRLILLSSSTWNDRFAAHEPALIIWLLKTAFYHPYLDLRLATSTLAASPELLSLLLVQPSALVDDEASGMEISTESVGISVTYADLGNAFVEFALQKSYAELGAVGVTSKCENPLRKYGLELLSRVARGFVSGYMPGYWTLKNLTSRR
ncbi:hypothetical protein B0J13DRAFT_526137 [Dactylonectria estremocensis]|uniref:NAD(P)-binding domain-containing protein n=1 Tax=Dactylonectria estremocensis TaxID=1079267 RepID=A0A9P9ER36_9HYPO|nr:hypothetical protein B0J13DRAFT_526137 [Dactylonectria estremocensis]